LNATLSAVTEAAASSEPVTELGARSLAVSDSSMTWTEPTVFSKVDELQQANPNVATSTTFFWSDLNGNKAYDPGEVDLNPNGRDFISSTIQGGGGAALSNGIPNPNEKEPRTDEFFLSLERELIGSLAVRATGIHSRAYNTYRLRNSLRPPSTYTVSVTNPDPGPDGRAGTADDPGTSITYYEYPLELQAASFQRPWLVNDPRADATYSSIELAASKRLSSRWMFMASYSATKRNVPIVQNNGCSNGLVLYIASDDPNAEINNSDDTWEWLGRSEGAYLLSFDALVSFHFEHRSGDAQARTVLLRGGRTIPSITLKAEPLGSLRLPNINVLDLRVEKTLRFTERQKLALRVNAGEYLQRHERQHRHQSHAVIGSKLLTPARNRDGTDDRDQRNLQLLGRYFTRNFWTRPPLAASPVYRFPFESTTMSCRDVAKRPASFPGPPKSPRTWSESRCRIQTF
jgi:hypothetical protein